MAGPIATGQLGSHGHSKPRDPHVPSSAGGRIVVTIAVVQIPWSGATDMTPGPAHSTRDAQSTFRRHPPGPKGLPLVGSALAIRRDVLGFFTACHRRFGDFVSFRVG